MFFLITFFVFPEAIALPTVKGSIDWEQHEGFFAYDVKTSGNYAFVASGFNGISVINIQNPENPVLVTYLQLVEDGDYDGVQHIEISGSFLYAVYEESGLFVVDISNPENPFVKGFNDKLTGVNDLFVKGSYLYATGYAFGIYGYIIIVNIENPENPIIMPSVGSQSINGAIYVEDDYAYVNGSDCLFIVNISDPINQTIEGVVKVPAIIMDFVVSNSMIYTGTKEHGLVIIDAQDHSTPFIASSLEHNSSWGASDSFYALAKAGTKVYALSNSELVTIDISDPKMPYAIGATDSNVMHGDINSNIYLKDQYIFVAEGFKFYTVDISEPESPMIKGDLNSRFEALDVQVKDGFAYVAAGNHGIKTFEIKAPDDIREADTIDTPYYARTFKISGTYLFVADDYGGLQIIDISDPKNIKATSQIKIDGIVSPVSPGVDRVMDLDISGNHAFLTTRDKVVAVNIENPESPFISDSLSDQSYETICIKDNYAYVGDHNNGVIHVLDISDPGDIKIINTISDIASLSLFISGNYLYATGSSSLQIIDISNSLSPVKKGTYQGTVSLGFGYDHIFVSGNFAYISQNHGNNDYYLNIVDVSDPDQPVSVESLEVDGEGNGLFVENDLVYLARGWKGLDVAKLSPEAAWVRPSSLFFQSKGLCSLKGFVLMLDNDVNQEHFGLHILDVSTSEKPMSKGTLKIPGAKRVFASAEYAYVTDSNKSVHVIDISDPSNPQIIGTFNSQYEIMDMRFLNNIAYCAAFEKQFLILDISNPADIKTKSITPISDWAMSLDVKGSYAYIGLEARGAYLYQGLYYHYGVEILDISNIESPEYVSIVMGSVGDIGSITAINSILYCYSGRYLQIADISNPAETKILSVLDLSSSGSGAGGMKIFGPHAYLAGSSGIQIVDISDPLNPERVWGFGSQIKDIFIKMPYIYMNSSDIYNSAFHVADISSFNKPGKGDLDNNGFLEIKDGLMALDILTAKRVLDLDIRAEIKDNKTIGIEEAIFIFKELHGK
jgi:hypothetical protein